MVTSNEFNSGIPVPLCLPVCSVPYRCQLHAGRFTGFYFDKHQPPSIWPSQRHEYIQIIFFGAGAVCTINWEHEGAWKSRDVCEPSLWVVANGVHHKLEWRKTALWAAFYVTPAVGSELAGVEITGASVFPLNTMERCDSRISELLNDFERLQQPVTQTELLHVESLASLVSIHLFHAWTCLTSLVDTWLVNMNAATLAKVDAFIESHIDQKVTLTGMAREVGMSKSNFLRLFKKRTGTTPGQYLIAFRIQKSKTLLLEKNWNIGSIALAVGFSSQGHFDFYFKKLTKMTPKEFRIAHKVGDIA